MMLSGRAYWQRKMACADADLNWFNDHPERYFLVRKPHHCEINRDARPDDVNASTDYPIAALTKNSNAPVAAAFEDFVLSPAGESVLTAAGFLQP